MENYNGISSAQGNSMRAVGVNINNYSNNFQSFRMKTTVDYLKKPDYVYTTYETDTDALFNYDSSKNQKPEDHYWKNLAIDLSVGVLSSAYSVTGLFGMSLGTFNMTAGIKARLKGATSEEAFKKFTDGAIVGNYTLLEFLMLQFGSTYNINHDVMAWDGFRSISLFVEHIEARNFARNTYNETLSEDDELIALTKAAIVDEDKALIKEKFKQMGMRYKFNTWLENRNKVKVAYDTSLADGRKALNEVYGGKAKSAGWDALFLIAANLTSDIIKGTEIADSMGLPDYREEFIYATIESNIIETMLSAAGVFVFGTIMPFGGYAVGTKAFVSLYNLSWKFCEHYSGLKRPVSEVDKLKFDMTVLKLALENTNSHEIYVNNKELYASGKISKAELDESALRDYADDFGYGTKNAVIALAYAYADSSSGFTIMPYLDGGTYDQFGVNEEWYEGKSGLDSYNFVKYLLKQGGYDIPLDTMYYDSLGTVIESGDIVYNLADDGTILSCGYVISDNGIIKILEFVEDSANPGKGKVIVKEFDSNSDDYLDDLTNNYNCIKHLHGYYTDTACKDYGRPDIIETEEYVKSEIKHQYYRRTEDVALNAQYIYEQGVISYNKNLNTQLYLAADKINTLNADGTPNGGYGTGISIAHVIDFLYENKDSMKFESATNGGYTGFGIPEGGFKGNSFDIVKWAYKNGGVNVDYDSLPKAGNMPRYDFNFTDGDMIWKDADGDGKYSDGDLFFICDGWGTFKGYDPNYNKILEVTITSEQLDHFHYYGNQDSEYKYINMKAYLDDSDYKNYSRPDMAIYTEKHSREAVDFYTESKKLYKNGQVDETVYHNAAINFQVNNGGYAEELGLSRLIGYTINNSDGFNIPYSDNGTYNNFGVDPEWYENGSSGLSSYGYVEWILRNAGYNIDIDSLNSLTAIYCVDIKKDKDNGCDLIGPYNDRIEIGDKFYIDDNGDGKYSDDECWVVTSATDEVWLENSKTGESFSIATVDTDYPTTTGGTYHYDAPETYEDFIEELGRGKAVEHEVKDYFGDSFNVKDMTVGDIFYNDIDGDKKITEGDECAIVESNDVENQKITIAKHYKDKDGNTYTTHETYDYSKFHDYQGFVTDIGMSHYINTSSYLKDNVNDNTALGYSNQRYDVQLSPIIT